jgi:hypothetical protein
MLRRVALVRTDVSEERSAPFIRATRIGELSSSETSVLTRATRRYIPEDAILHSHRRENLKSYTEDRWFKTPCSELISSIYLILTAALGPGALLSLLQKLIP